MPSALRKVSTHVEGKAQCQLRSEAYVHGMMFSQAWNLIEDYRPRVSPEELVVLYDQLPRSITRTPGMYKARKGFVCHLQKGYEQIQATLGKRTIVLV